MRTHEPESPSAPPASAPSKSWLLALDDRSAGQPGWKPVVPGAAERASVRLPRASQAEFQAEPRPWQRLSGPLCWALGGLVLLGLGAVGWQLVRAHARPSAPAAPLAPPAPEVEPLPATPELETGALQRQDAASPAAASCEALERADAARPTASGASNARARLLERRPPADLLAFRFPRVSNSSVRDVWALKPSGPAAGAPIEAAAPRTRIVGRASLSGVWQGATLPIGALDGRSKWLTPAVGRVEVELADGSTFEGRAHSIGEGQIWIETELGRMAFAGARIARLRQLPPATAENSQQGLVPELPWVRARTAGGVFVGRLLRQDESRAVLLTAEGGEVTLEGAAIEPVGAAAGARRP